MPYPTIKAAQDASFPTRAEDIDLTLAQVNHLAKIYDAIKKSGEAKNPMAVAWEQWKKLYIKKDGKWERHKANFLSGPLVNIKRMEIFKVGTWNNQKFEGIDIQNMSDNFHKLKGTLTPKLKITHRDNQESIAGLASYGDVINMYIESERLYADLSSVPLQVAEWIRDKRFAERSIELHHRFMINGNEYHKVISAIALLGHEVPAVAGMGPVKLSKEDNSLNKEEAMAVTFANDSAFVIERGNGKGTGGQRKGDGGADVCYCPSCGYEEKHEKGVSCISKICPKCGAKLKGGDTEMDLKEVMAKIASMEKTIAGFVKLQEDAKGKLAKEKQETEVTALKAKISEYTENIKQFEGIKADYEKIKVAFKKSEEEKTDLQKKAKTAEVDTFISAEKTAGRIIPAFEAEAKALLVEADTEKKIGKFAKIGEDGKSSEAELSQFEAFKNLISKLPKLVDFKESSHNHKGNEADEKEIEVNGDNFELDSVELNAEAEKYMKEHKCSLEDALAAMSIKFKTQNKAQGFSIEE